MKFKRNGKIYLAAGAIVMLLVFFNFIGWLNPIKTLARNLFTPVFVKTNDINIKVGEEYEFFKDRDSFFTAYNACRLENANNTVNEALVKSLRDENLELREILKFKEKSTVTTTLARVIGKNIEQTDQAMIIDRGLDDGVSVGQPVIVGEGIIIGKITEAENDTAIIRLINDSQSKIAGTVLDTDKSLGVVEGGYGLSVKMNFIPRNETIKVGDIVVTSGLESGIPRGLVIGTVTAIENETYQPFQAALLTPGVELDKLSIVAVLRVN